jgi:hypothetical protein
MVTYKCTTVQSGFRIGLRTDFGLALASRIIIRATRFADGREINRSTKGLFSISQEFLKLDMKTKLVLFATFLICLVAISQTVAQYNFNEKAIMMLRQFYTAYSYLRITLNDERKSDSLQKKYCTFEARKVAKEDFSDGYDFYTSDWGINSKAINTMSINEDPINPTIYFVSYIVDTFPVSPDKPVKRKIILRVKVVEERESYKIASVADATQ